jgi:hypothetical protein
MSSDESKFPPSQRADRPRREKLAMGSGEPGIDPPKPSAAERERIRREERLRPYVECLGKAPADQFAVNLSEAVKALQKEHRKRTDVRSLLQAAWSCVPPTLEGWAVAKHYKAGSDWNRAEIVWALDDLREALLARTGQAGEMGAVLHGALIELVGAASKQKSLEPTGVPADDVIRALVDLHTAAQSLATEPFRGIGDPSPRVILTTASNLIGRYSQRPEVRATNGHRLFGFDFVVELPEAQGAAGVGLPARSRLSEKVEAAGPAIVHAQKQDALRHDAVSHGPPPHPGAELEELRRRVSVLKTAQMDAARQSKVSDAARDRFRRDLEASRASEEALRLQLKQAIELRETLADRIAALQSELDATGEIKAQLSHMDALVRERDAQIAQFALDLQRADLQNQTAKDSEFQRGRSAMRAQISVHCVESLRQMAEVAAPVAGDAGKFLREMSLALANYLDEGRS